MYMYRQELRNAHYWRYSALLDLARFAGVHACALRVHY